MCQHHLWQRLSFIYSIAFKLCQKLVVHICVGQSLDSVLYFLNLLSIIKPIPHVMITEALNKSWNQIELLLYISPFFKIFGVWGPLNFHNNFRIILSIFTKFLIFLLLQNLEFNEGEDTWKLVRFLTKYGVSLSAVFPLSRRINQPEMRDYINLENFQGRLQDIPLNPDLHSRDFAYQTQTQYTTTFIKVQKN